RLLAPAELGEGVGRGLPEELGQRRHVELAPVEIRQAPLITRGQITQAAETLFVHQGPLSHDQRRLSVIRRASRSQRPFGSRRRSLVASARCEGNDSSASPRTMARPIRSTASSSSSRNGIRNVCPAVPGVFTNPGWIVVTLTPCRPRSTRNPSRNVERKAFDP